MNRQSSNNSRSSHHMRLAELLAHREDKDGSVLSTLLYSSKAWMTCKTGQETKHLSLALPLVNPKHLLVREGCPTWRSCPVPPSPDNSGVLAVSHMVDGGWLHPKRWSLRQTGFQQKSTNIHENTKRDWFRAWLFFCLNSLGCLVFIVLFIGLSCAFWNP